MGKKTKQLIQDKTSGQENKNHEEGKKNKKRERKVMLLQKNPARAMGEKQIKIMQTKNRLNSPTPLAHQWSIPCKL